MVEQLVMKGDLEQALITFQRETVKQPPEEIERIRSRPTWPSLLATIAVHQSIEALRLSFPNPTLVELEGQGHNATMRASGSHCRSHKILPSHTRKSALASFVTAVNPHKQNVHADRQRRFKPLSFESRSSGFPT